MPVINLLVFVLVALAPSDSKREKKHLEKLQPPANNQKVTFAKTAETSTSNTSSKY